MLDRARRLTRQELEAAESHQSEIVAALIASGHHDIAQRLQRCQQERRNRQPGRYPWRCRSAGCWACRRTLMLAWWRGFHEWLGDQDVSLMVIPLDGDPVVGVRKLRKGLRDVRDRAAQRDQRWAGVAMGGLATEDAVLVLVQHRGLDRIDMSKIFQRRWPDAVFADTVDNQPSWAMVPKVAAALACLRRGTEPLRIVVPSRSKASVS